MFNICNRFLIVFMDRFNLIQKPVGGFNQISHNTTVSPVKHVLGIWVVVGIYRYLVSGWLGIWMVVGIWCLDG